MEIKLYAGPLPGGFHSPTCEVTRDDSGLSCTPRLAVIKSFARYTAVERPEFLNQATQILAVKQKKTPDADMGRLTGGEV